MADRPPSLLARFKKSPYYRHALPRAGTRASDTDVAATRGKLGLSQEQFAAAFGVSLGTVRNWEQGRRTPDGPALVLLTVIDKSPRTVLRAIWPGPSKGKAAA